MKSFALLWGKILDSSIWLSSKETRLVWITMLAMKDADGIVRAAVPGLAHRARVEVDECVKALEELSSPDPYSSSKECEGRRIEHLNGVGWKVVNHEKYLFSTEAKRLYWAEQKRKERARRQRPSLREKQFIKNYADGNQTGADNLLRDGI